MDNKFQLKSKLMIPDIPVNTLYSDRLKGLNIAGHRVVTVTAPAGYGKTTAILLSLKEYRDHIHWYRLGKEDASLPVFFGSLIEALFAQNTHNTDSITSMSSIGDIAKEYALLSAVICQDTWAGYTTDAPDRYLVFDDFQNAAGNEIICEIVGYLIDNMPPNMHIIVVSRIDTIRTEKLMLGGNFLAINQSDLLFTKAETDQLFTKLGIKDVNRDNLSIIYTYTEGWIAGIIMLMHTADRLNLKDGKAFDGDKTAIIKYLLSEVLSGFDGDKVKQTAKISLLSEFTDRDLSEVFQIDDSDKIIDWLETNNLYIQKIGDTPPVYRFHSLFRDALRPYLEQTYLTEEITAFRIKAADRFEKTGRYIAAIEQYLLAGDSEKAADLAAVEGQLYMDNGDIDSAAELIYSVPESMLHQHATLLMILGASLLNTQTDRSLTYLEKALSMSVKEKNIELAINIQGLMISVCAQRSDFRNIKNIVSQVPMFRAMISSKHARNMLLMSLFTKSVVTDNVKMSKILMRIIDRIPQDEDLWEYSNLITKATLYGVDGDFTEAENIIHKITEHPIALRNDRWRSLGLYISCNLAILMSERNLSRKLIENLASIGEKYDSGYSAGSAAFFTGMLKYQDRDFEDALSAISHAEGIFIDNQNHVMAVFARVLQTSWRSEISDGEDFSVQSAEELNGVMALGSYHGLLELAQTVSAVQYLQNGVYDRAEDLLLKAYKGAKDKQASQILCGIAMHLVILYEEKKDHRQAEKYLKFFGKTSAQNGYLYFREMNYTALVRVCARSVENKISPEHMMKIISAYFGPDAVEELIRNPSEIATDPRSYVDRYPIQTPFISKDIYIKLFGQFRLVIDGQDVDPSMWRTRKISGILKYILSRPNKTVSRETLATVFWPNSNSKAAFTSLRVALFELRKTLASLEMPFDSKEALIAEDKRGFFVCNPEFVRSDVNEFFTQYKRSITDELSDDERHELFQQMLELYDGDYFADESFEDWIEVLREQYRSIYIDTSNKLVEYCYGKGNTQQAEMLLFKQMEIDPYNETACQMLISLYDESDRHDQAAALSRQFIRRFKQEMGVEPTLN